MDAVFFESYWPPEWEGGKEAPQIHEQRPHEATQALHLKRHGTSAREEPESAEQAGDASAGQR